MLTDFCTNPVLLSVVILLILSALRLNVVFSLVIAALCGGMLAGMNGTAAMKAFTGGLGNGAAIAFNYAMLHCHFTFRRHGTHRAGAFQADRRRSHEEKALFLQIHPSPDPDSGCHFLTEPDSRPHRFHSGSDSAPAPCF